MEANYIQDMINQIDSYNKNEITLAVFLNKAEGIYNILESDSDDNFRNIFHSTWDVLDEINATNGEDANSAEIKNVILPKFASELQSLF